MDQHCARDPRRAPFARFVRRAAVLGVLGTGLWLGGQATAAAEELTVPPTTSAATTSEIGRVALPVAAVAPPVVQAAEPLVETTAPLQDVAAPVVKPIGRAVSPVVEPIGRAVSPVVEPIGRAVSPVVEPIGRAFPPAVEVVGEAVAPVTEAVVPPPALLEPLLPAPVDAPTPVLGGGLTRSQDLPEVGSHSLSSSLHDLADDTSRPGGVLPRAADHVTAADPGLSARHPGPVRPPTPSAGGPAGARCAQAHSFDQSPADLSADVLPRTTAALVATGDARDAAGNIASDPSFSPD